MIVPYFTILEFISYMGWIKVSARGRFLISPLGANLDPRGEVVTQG
jgi:hypothetical protein